MASKTPGEIPLMLLQQQPDGRWKGPETELGENETIEEAIERVLTDALQVKLDMKVTKFHSIYDKGPIVKIRYLVLTTFDEINRHQPPPPEHGWSFIQAEQEVDAKDFVEDWSTVINEMIEHYKKY